MGNVGHGWMNSHYIVRSLLHTHHRPCFRMFIGFAERIGKDKYLFLVALVIRASYTVGSKEVQNQRITIEERRSVLLSQSTIFVQDTNAPFLSAVIRYFGLVFGNCV